MHRSAKSCATTSRFESLIPQTSRIVAFSAKQLLICSGSFLLTPSKYLRTTSSMAAGFTGAANPLAGLAISATAKNAARIPTTILELDGVIADDFGYDFQLVRCLERRKRNVDMLTANCRRLFGSHGPDIDHLLIGSGCFVWISKEVSKVG
jgi:hypothetical protein